MSSNRPNPTAKNAPPTSRRSARQRRLANREENRRLSRASTSGSSGSSLQTLTLWTVVALIVGAVVIGGAYLLTRSSNAAPTGSPIAPSVTTPTNIAQSDRTLGDASAKVTVDVWEDFRCTGCFAFRTEIEPTVVEKYVATGKAKIVYHDFLTIDQPGQTESRDAANAARCAAAQGKFWVMHDWLFANQSPRELAGAFTIDRLVAIGKAAGMDMSTFEPCVRNGTYNAQVAAEMSSAPSSIASTPSIFVDGKLVTDPTNAQLIPSADIIGAAIDAALSPSASPSASASTGASATPAASVTAAPTATTAPSASPS
jgi:protein-disulfide isomerase